MVAAKRKNKNDTKVAPQRVKPAVGTYGRRRISIRAKLALLLLVTLAIVVALAAMGLTALNQIGDAHLRAERTALLLTSERTLEQARLAIEDASAAVLKGAAGDFSVDLAQAQMVLEQANQRLIDGLPALKGADSAEMQEALSAQADLVQRYVAQARKFAAGVTNAPDSATAVFVELQTLDTQLSLIQSTLNDQFEQANKLRIDESVTERRNAMTTMRAGLVVAIGLIVAVAWFVRWSISRQIKRLGTEARLISRGDFAARVSGTGTDELGSLARTINAIAATVEQNIARRETQADSDTFSLKLVEEFEQVSSEDALLAVVGRAMQEISSSTPMDLLFSDRDHEQTLTRVAVSASGGAAGCSVTTTYGCIAMRAGHQVVFANSQTGDCPRLRERRGPAVCAVCVPVMYMDKAVGVVHATTPLHAPLSTMSHEQMEVLAKQAGIRIETNRNHLLAQQLATFDGLTGLRNRRTIEEDLRMAVNAGGPLTVVLADIDHFKKLNDTAGHEQGDRALQLFSYTMEQSFREGDRCGRYGGEEFVIVLPGASLSTALEAIHRFRENVARASVEFGLPVITASFGVVDNTMGNSLESLLRLADAAMYRAKNEGRNRAIVADARDLAVVRAGAGRGTGVQSSGNNRVSSTTIGTEPNPSRPQEALL